MAEPAPAPFDDDPLWFKDAVIYELHVRAFHDADGDGIGDFRGLTQKLDYLADLGVTALWLLPFYPSPLRDDGYDIADFEAVHPDYGTMRDVKRFVKAAHDRGLRVINELVINHTSDQHRWFDRAVKAAPGSPERDFYVWSDDPSRWDEARIIFQDFERSNWTWHPDAEAYYWHRFYSHQPDLNFDNPAVGAAVKKVLDQWADLGVDGMRLDAIPYLFERDGTNCENLPETHEFLKELRAHLDANHSNRMFLAEANQWPEDAAAYFGDGDECHMNFHFPLMPRLFMSVRMEDRFPIVDILQQTPEIPDNCQWAVFLRNHDELTLEMVTDEERDYMRRVYARDPRMRINLGIRRRLAPLLDNDRRLIELLNALLFSMPGTPVLYYGDELGMGDNIYLGDRDGVRTPMQWSGDRNAGFSSANPQRLFLPVVTDPGYHYETVNVEAQQDNPASLLRWMQRLISLRKRHRVFGRGTLTFLYPDNPKILAFVREWEDEQVLVVANLSRHAQPVDLDLGAHAGVRPVELFGQTPFPTIGADPYRLTLAPFGFYWFDLAATGYAASVNPRSLSSTSGEEEVPTVDVAFDRATAVGGAFESVLPAVLRTRRWFGGKARTIQQTTIRASVTVPGADGPCRLLLVDVAYAQGEPDLYVMPVQYVAGPAADGDDLLARIETSSTQGAIRDATANPAFARRLASLVTSRRRLKAGTGQVVEGRAVGARPDVDPDQLSVRALGAEQSNTSVLLGDDLVMKVVRNAAVGVNPEVEMTAALRDGGFPHSPATIGSVVYDDGDGERVIAVLQEFVVNEGDAWGYALGAVSRFLETDDVTALPAPRGTLVELAGKRIPERVLDHIGNELESFELLGRRTAEMHNVLGDADADGFAPETMGKLAQRAIYQGLRMKARRTLSTVKRQARRLEGELADAAAAVADREADVLAVFERVREGELDGLRIRTHGDYHLGQVLWTGRDFVIIDFEGEPAAPLGERRLVRSPLRDVAGMLRSFAYAGRSGHAAVVERGASDADGTLDTAARRWARWCQVAYLRGYRDAIDARLVPSSDDGFGLLLDAFLLEKTLYELSYELNNRPDWVAIPLDGVTQLLGDHD